MLHLIVYYLVSTVYPALEAREESKRPNVIFIYSDALGWGDLGCYGHPRLKTSNLDKMADDGLLVSNFYVANPVSSPSRTATMTGPYPARHGVHQPFSDPRRHAARNMTDFLDPNVTLVTRLMQENRCKLYGLSD